MRVGTVRTIGTAVATGVLALGYGLDSRWAGVGLTLVVGILWLVGQWRDWGWRASPAFVLLVGTAAVGLGFGLAGGWMLIGVMAALSAWDLDHFAQRLRHTARVEKAFMLERTHLRRLLAVDVTGLLLGAIALGVNIRLGFTAAFILGLLAVWGLSRAVRFLRREGW